MREKNLPGLKLDYTPQNGGSVGMATEFKLWFLPEGPSVMSRIVSVCNASFFCGFELDLFIQDSSVKGMRLKRE